MGLKDPHMAWTAFNLKGFEGLDQVNQAQGLSRVGLPIPKAGPALEGYESQGKRGRHFV